MSRSKWHEYIEFRDPQPSRQQIAKEYEIAKAIDKVLEDAYTSFCIRLRSEHYNQESAFKTAVHDYAASYVEENPWLYGEEEKEET